MPADMQPQSVPYEYLGAPGDFNPTLLMFLAAVALVMISTTGFFCWNWPNWVTFSANVLALHFAGTVIHDASHNVAHRDRIMNSILGHGSALLLGFAFPVFTRVHMQHHARNQPSHHSTQTRTTTMRVTKCNAVVPTEPSPNPSPHYHAFTASNISTCGELANRGTTTFMCHKSAA